MTLPSQVARTSSMSRSTLYRRRKRSAAAPIAVVGSLVAVVAAAWWTFGRGDGVTRRSEAAPEPARAAAPAPRENARPPAQPPNAPTSVRNDRPANPPPSSMDARSNPAAPSGAGGPPAGGSPPPARPADPPRPEGTPAPASPGAGGAPQSPAGGGDGGKGEASAAQAALAAAEQAVRQGDPLKARTTLNAALRLPGATDTERQAIRERLASLNDDLLFGPKIHPGEPFTEQYTVAPGDSLVKIVKSRGLHTQFRLIARVNRLTSPDKISLGQRLKLVKGPFHAVVDKSGFRLDVFIGPAEKPESWLYVRSFRVGLGEGDSTPVGTFVVKKNSKLENPFWVNPRTGEKFAADDPKNPIGERWIGLEGQGGAAVYQGYGIHGTIEPESIGQMRSMGCVRLGADDAEFVYQLLAEGVSVVRIEP